MSVDSIDIGDLSNLTMKIKYNEHILYNEFARFSTKKQFGNHANFKATIRANKLLAELKEYCQNLALPTIIA